MGLFRLLPVVPARHFISHLPGAVGKTQHFLTLVNFATHEWHNRGPHGRPSFGVVAAGLSVSISVLPAGRQRAIGFAVFRITQGCYRLNVEKRVTDGAVGASTLVGRGLKKSYGDFEAVKGVDFEVRAGECFGFLGPNGAGKTSTMKMIYAAAVPTGGELSVVGLDVGRHEREVKRRIGVVPQENNLDEGLKVRENLLVYGRYFDLPGKVVAQRADELLDFVQLTEKAEQTVESLSGGMKRRLLIARALVNDPDLVVLDEPTTGLDPQARHLVWDKLRELARGGKTLILTTHYMEEAARLCDRLVIMDGGEIIAEGSPSDLVEKYVSPRVLEFRSDPASLDRLRPILEEIADSVEEGGSVEALLAFARDPHVVTERVHRSGIKVDNTVQRESGLEDVFMRLTGRRLAD
jgi:lipooligosaccharide transport system ATP-binding protein